MKKLEYRLLHSKLFCPEITIAMVINGRLAYNDDNASVISASLVLESGGIYLQGKGPTIVEALQALDKKIENEARRLVKTKEQT